MSKRKTSKKAGKKSAKKKSKKTTKKTKKVITSIKPSGAAPEDVVVTLATRIIRGVRNEDVPDIVAMLIQDPRYVSHEVIPDGPGTSTIIVIYRDE